MAVSPINAKLGLLLAVFSLSLASCTIGKKDPVRDHAGPPPVTHKTEQGEEQSTLGKVDLRQLHARAQEKNVDKVREVLLPLGQELFSKKRLRSSDLQAKEETAWALQFYNETLLAAHVAAPKDENVAKFLGQYRKLVLDGCQGKSLKDCSNFFFFKKDPTGTNSIIRILIRQTADVREYFRLIYVAYELGNRQPNDDLTFLAFNRTMDLLKSFVKVTVKKDDEIHLSIAHLKPDDLELYKLNLTLLGTLANSGSKEAKVNGLRKDAKELLNWISSSDIATVLGANLVVEINKLLGEWLTSDDVWPTLVKNIERFESKEEESYTNNMKFIKPAMLQAFNIEPLNMKRIMDKTPRSMVTLYFLSRIMALKPQSQEMYLWNISERNPKETMDYIQALVKMSLLANVQRTNDLMAKGFKQLQQDRRPKDEILRRMIEYAKTQVAPNWTTDFFSRTARLESFFSTYIEQKYQTSSASGIPESIQETRRMFDQLNNSVKYMATYPNMFMLAYFATIFNYSETVAVPDGNLVIDHNLLLRDLLDGRIRPMFEFTVYKSGDSKMTSVGLDKIEILWSLNYLFKSNLLASYGVSLKDFLQVVFRKYKEPNDNALRNWITRLEEYTRDTSPLKKTFDYCDALTPDNQLVTTFELPITLEDISQYTYLGEPGLPRGPKVMKDGGDMITQPVRFAKKNLDDALEVIRSDVDPKLRRLSIMRIMLNNLPETAETKAAVAEIDAQLKESNTLKSSIISGVENIADKASYCFIRFSDIEFSRQRQLVKMELQFAADVFAGLNILSDLKKDNVNINKVTVAELQALKPQHLLFTDKRFSQVPKEEALRPAFNSWLAQKTYLSDIFKVNAEYKNDYRQNAAIQQDGAGKLYFNSRSEDFLVRAASFLKYGYDDVVLSPKPDRTLVTYPLNVSELKEVIYGESPISPIYPTVKVEDFQISFIDLIRDRTTWFQGDRGMVGFIRFRNKDQAALYKIKFESELDAQKILDCDEACLNRTFQDMKTSVGKFAELSNRALKRMSLNKETIDLLKWLRTDSYYDIDNSSFFLRGAYPMFISGNAADEYLGFLEDFYNFTATGTLGYKPMFRDFQETASSGMIPDPNTSQGPNGDMLTGDDLYQRPDIYNDALTYYPTLRDEKERLILPLPDVVLRSIRGVSMYLVQREMLLNAAMEEGGNEWAAAGNALEPIHFAAGRDPLLNAPMVSQTLLNNYFEMVRKINNQTNGIYVPDLLKRDRRWYTSPEAAAADAAAAAQ